MRTLTSKNTGRRRTRRTPEQRQAIIRQYRASGLGRAAFCRRYQVNLATFCHWMNAQPGAKRRGSTATKSKMKFAEVQVALSGTAPVEIVLASGVCIRLRDLSRPEKLAEFLRELTRC